MSGVSRGDIVPSLFLKNNAGGAGREERSDTAAIVADTLPLLCTPSLKVHDEVTDRVSHSQALLDYSTRWRSTCRLAYFGLAGADADSAQIVHGSCTLNGASSLSGSSRVSKCRKGVSS